MKILLSLCVNVLLVLSVSAQKKVLIEKFTNMHCGVCPSGTIEIERLQEEYPDLIWVSHHKPITWAENELNNEQSTALWNDLGGPSNPTAMVDRTVIDNSLITGRNSWEGRVVSQLSAENAASINIDEVTFDKDSRTFAFRVNSSFESLSGNSDYRITVMILEDYFNSAGAQSSYYNDVAGHPLEGLGSSIWDYEHRNVVRAILDNHWGSDDVIPADPIVGETYSKNYSYAAPEDFKLERIKVVAFVAKHVDSDFRARAILNATEIEMNDYGFQLSATNDTEAPSETLVSVSPNPVSSLLNISYNEQPSLVQLISAKGQIVYEVRPAASEFTVDVSSYSNGTYILISHTPAGKVAKHIAISK